MKKTDIQLGQTYRAKMSGNITSVRIVAVNHYGGWDAINLGTGRMVRIKSAQRLRAAITESEAERLAAFRRGYYQDYLREQEIAARVPSPLGACH